MFICKLCFEKKNTGLLKKKKKNKNVEILHLWKVWSDVKSDAFTSEKLLSQM